MSAVCIAGGQREVFADLHRHLELAGDQRRAGVVVVPDRLLQPGDALAVERAAPRQRLIEAERLVVVDHQRDAVRNALLDGVHRGEIVFGKVG